MNAFNTRPLYLQVFDALAKKIMAGEWGKGDAIPNEHDLSTELGVSIGTLRKAIDALVVEKMVSRRQGKGTYVIDRMSPEVRNIFDPIRKSDGAPIDWLWTILNLQTRTPTAEEKDHLHLGDDELVTVFTRVGSDLKRPIRFEIACVPEKIFGNAKEIAPAHTKIVPLAFRFGILLGQIDERISVRSASKAAASSLKIKSGDPILYVRRLVLDVSGSPIEWACMECNLVDEYYKPPSVGMSDQ